MSDILARMRQLVGTTAQWAANDIVIGDGEIAFERPVSGTVRLKIGDGVSTWSELDYLGGLIPTFGADYTWQDKTGSRSDNTNYTSPDHPIQVSYCAEFLSNTGSAVLVVDGIEIAIAANGGNGAMIQTITAVVPPDTVYRVNTSLLNGRDWLELRAD